jgi:hypothetical protein
MERKLFKMASQLTKIANDYLLKSRAGMGGE